MLTLKYCGSTMGTKVTRQVNTFGDNCTWFITKCVVFGLHLEIIKHKYRVDTYSKYRINVYVIVQLLAGTPLEVALVSDLILPGPMISYTYKEEPYWLSS